MFALANVGMFVLQIEKTKVFKYKMGEKHTHTKKMECSIYMKASFHDQSYVVSTLT